MCEPGKVLITIGVEQPDYMPEPQVIVPIVPYLTDNGRIKRKAAKEDAESLFE